MSVTDVARRIHLGLGVLIMALAGTLACSERFSGGDRVWVDLPAETVRLSGHAEGRVVEIKGEMVLVQFEAIEVRGATRSAVGLAPGGASYVPLERVSEWEAGHSRFLKVNAAWRNLEQLVDAPERFSPLAADPLRQLAIEMKLHEVVESLSVLEVVAPLLSARGSAVVDMAPETLEALRTRLLELDGEYYSTAVLFPDPGEPSEPDSMPAPAVIARQTLDKVASLIALWVANPDFRTLPDEIERVRRADRAYYSFVSDGGRLPIDGVALNDHLDGRWKLRREALANRARMWVIEESDNGPFESLEEAETALEANAQANQTLADSLDVDLFDAATRRRFLQPTVASLEAIEAEAERSARRQQALTERAAERERAAREHARLEAERAAEKKRQAEERGARKAAEQERRAAEARAAEQARRDAEQRRRDALLRSFETGGEIAE